MSRSCKFTTDDLKAMLHYDPLTGVFTWLCSPNRRIKVGSVAGTKTHDGYVNIRIDGKNYGAHRLAFLYMEGYMPDTVDHKDTDPQNNKWVNLRACTQGQNTFNATLRVDNSSGVKNVVWSKRYKRWYVMITKSGVRHWRGFFDTIEEATDAAKELREILHGDFANSG